MDFVSLERCWDRDLVNAGCVSLFISSFADSDSMSPDICFAKVR